MIYLHKILPVFFLPVGVTLLLVVSGVAFRRKWLVWLGVAVLWLSSTPAIGESALRATEGSWARREAAAVRAADAIVVLSGGRIPTPRKSSISGWEHGDRFFSGIELFKAHKAPRLVFTGALLPWDRATVSEGTVLAAQALKMGVPAESILVTARVANTADEARAVAAALRASRRSSADSAQRPRVLLVTSAFHMPRARMLFERNGLIVDPFPVDFQVQARGRVHVLDFLPTAGALQQTELAWRELYGRMFYSVFR